MFQLTVNVVAVFCTLIGAFVLRQDILEPIQMLWVFKINKIFFHNFYSFSPSVSHSIYFLKVNLIMDSLASLALSTEEPNQELLKRKPHDRNEYIISKKMFKHVIGHAIYQFVVIMLIVFAGKIKNFKNL